jgi:hypothetical protein
MAQRRIYDCDVCGDEVGTAAQPLVYLVVGSLENGAIDQSARLPAFVWAIMAQKTERQENPYRREWCGACLAADIARYGTELLTLAEFEAQWTQSASRR